MSSIDNRIVNMQFNNKGFESGVSSTLSSLKKLDESLKMKSGSKGLDDVSKSIGKLSSGNLSGLGAGVDAVTAKFSALGVMGVTALANITNSAVNAGKNLVKSLTLDPITTGFSEYETKMNAIQTILTNTKSKGTTLDDVNKALNELNEYSDKTIYNFAEMTKNIGTFTAAGVDLNTSVQAIKGISNLAAGSGSTPQQAATAMYQLSQALAAGKVSLQDWNSVVNAGMGGELFQKALIETAKGMGKVVDAGKPFRETLQDGWLTSDVLTKTLQKFADDPSLTQAATQVKTLTGLLDTMKESVQSGWAQSMEYIFGNKDQAAELFTGLSEAFNNLIGPSADARNEMLKFWNETGGRQAVLDGLGNVINSIGKGLGAIGDGFRDVFPAMTGKQLVEFSKGFKELTENFKMSDSVAKQIRDTFKGLFSIFKIGGQAVSGLVKAFAPLAGTILSGISTTLLNVTSGVGNFVTEMGNAITKSGVFENITKGIQNAFSGLNKFLTNLGSGINNVFKSFSKNDFGPFFEFIKGLSSGVGSGIAAVFTGIGEAISKININTLVDALAAFFAGKGITNINKAAESFKGLFDTLMSVPKKAAGILDSVRDSLEAYQTSLNAGTLVKIATAIAVLAGSLAVLSSLDADAVASGLSAMTMLFIELVASMAALTKISADRGLIGMGKITFALLGISTSILILSGAMKAMSGLKWDEITKGLTGIAGSVLILAGASKLLSGNSKGLISTATGLLILSVAIKGMASAIKMIGSLDVNTIVKGLSGMAGVLLEMAAFTKLIGKPTGMISTATGMVILSGAMMLLGGALKVFGTISWDEMGRGLTAMAGSLIILAGAVALISGAKLAAIGAGVTIMSGGLMLLSLALAAFGSMSLETIGTGILALAGSLLVLALAMTAMSGGLIGALAMTVMAGALALFVPQLMLLSQLNIQQIGMGLLAMAGAFTVLGIAALVLAPVVPALIALAGAVALFGAGALAAGTGITLLAGGLATLAAVGVAGCMALAEGLKQLLNLIPLIGQKLAEGLTAFVTGLANSAPKLITAVSTLISSMLQAFSQAIPQIAQAGVDLVVALAGALADAIPRLVSAGVDMVIAVVEGIGQNIGRLIQAGADLINSLADGIRNNSGAVISAGQNLVMALVEAIGAGVGALSQSGGKLVGSFVKGFISQRGAASGAGKTILEAAKTAISSGSLVSAGSQLIDGFKSGILSKAADVATAAKNVVSNAISAAKNALGIHSPSRVFHEIGDYTIQGFANGLRDSARLVDKPANDFVNRTIEGVKSSLSTISDIVSNGIDTSPVITPVMDLSNVKDGSKTIGSLMNASGLLSTNASGAMIKSMGTIQNGNENAEVVSALKDLKKEIGNNANTTYQINGITYDDGSSIQGAIETLIRAAKIERRV